MLKVTSEVDGDALKTSSAIALGFAGLIPFWTVPFFPLAAGWFGEDVALAVSQWIVIYAAVIASFMSGGRWAFRIMQPDTRPAAVFGGFLGAVVPALVVWVIASLPDPLFGMTFGPMAKLFWIAVILILQLFQDDEQALEGGIPGWYMRLRTMLVIGASTPILLPIILNTLLAFFTGVAPAAAD